MKVCVTGASGFIGRHVCEALGEAGHSVVGLDIVASGPFDCVADITKPIAKVDGINAVIHLAAMANPRECDADPARAFNVNVNGTHQVLRMALESGARKFVFASSAHVYDIPPKYMPSDEVHPLRLNNTYTTTKILGEQLCHLYYENHGLSYTTLRLYNAYGPGQGRGYFIPDMIAKAKAGPVSLTGGSTTKDFVYIADVAQAFVRAVQSDFVGPINIGTGKETDLQTIAKFIADKAGVGFYATPSSNGSRMQANNSRAKWVLGWSPTIMVKDGLERILASGKVPV